MVYEGDRENLSRAQTAAFSIAAFSQLIFSLSCRSLKRTMPQMGLLSNPYLLAAILVSGLLQTSVLTVPLLQPVFKTVGRLGWEWLLAIALSLAPTTIIEIEKLIRAAIRRF